MKVQKFCKCGVKLERDVANEDAARTLVLRFFAEHSGQGHGLASRREYLQAVSRIVARNAKVNKPREPRPLLSAITRAEAAVDQSHRWEALPGIEFCRLCKVVRRDGHQLPCVGLALMKPSGFVGYPLPWLRGA